jgi:tripartite-type tricarboxylate transporter receptor subunit TctC
MKKLLQAVLLSLSLSAAAADPQFIVNPYPPGGSSDIISRQIEKHFAKENKNLVITFKPGAEGYLAVEDTVRNNKPGTFVYVGGGLLVIKAQEDPAMKAVLDQLKPVAMLYAHNVVAMTNNPELKTWVDVQAVSKTRPIKIGAWNRNTDGVLESSLDQSVVAKYKGTVQIMVDLKNNTLDVGILPYPQAKDFIERGVLTPLVSIGPNPDVVPNYSKFSKNSGVESFFNIYASPATPDAEVEEFIKDVTSYLNDPQTIEYYKSNNLHIRHLTGADLTRYIEKQRRALLK